jgi:hypothetical protein
MMAIFLTPDEVAELTDRKFKSLQIKWLRANSVAFRISATGNPKVVRSVIEGHTASTPPPIKAAWVPRVLAKR